jgi:hypothetical protein
LRPLDEVLQRVSVAARAGERPVVVFDIDSTLFDTARRNLWIVRQWAGGGAFADLADDLLESEFGWDVAEPLMRRGPLPAEALAALREHWRAHFFTDEAVGHDAPAPGAAAFARAVHDAGGHAYYLTGRHIDGMGLGTAGALTRHGFPLWRGRTTLHMKPHFDLPDGRFKALALADIRDTGTTVATFDNEPGNCNVFRRAFPSARHFLFGRVRSPDAELPDDGVEALDSFER